MKFVILILSVVYTTPDSDAQLASMVVQQSFATVPECKQFVATNRKTIANANREVAGKFGGEYVQGFSACKDLMETFGAKPKSGSGAGA